VPDARRLGVGHALLAAIVADARTRGLEFAWWTSRTWNTESHAFFRTIVTAEEPVIAFAVFGERFDKLADEGSSSR
jgi:GNAT superfamily N-acetyltransferase